MILLLVSLSLSGILILGIIYAIFNFLIHKCPSFKNFIFGHNQLVFLQKFVIHRDTTRNFPDGFQPSQAIVRAPTMYKINKSISTESSNASGPYSSENDESFNGSIYTSNNNNLGTYTSDSSESQEYIKWT
mgnify:CR=1 FL=1